MMLLYVFISLAVVYEFFLSPLEKELRRIMKSSDAAN